MPRSAVRSEPRWVPRRVEGRLRQGDHAADPGPAGRPRDLRQPRQRSIPQPHHRPPRLRRHDRSCRHDVHLESRHHQQHIQDRPRPANRQLRAHATPRQILSARRQRQPLQNQASNAHRTPRPKRRQDRPIHKNHRHRLPQDQKGQDKTQATRAQRLGKRLPTRRKAPTDAPRCPEARGTRHAMRGARCACDLGSNRTVLKSYAHRAKDGPSGRCVGVHGTVV